MELILKSRIKDVSSEILQKIIHISNIKYECHWERGDDDRDLGYSEASVDVKNIKDLSAKELADR